MGALPPLTPWIPHDDLLLKNAIEAGASLESLAKGAVQFSRRFTIRELQERWHSLLYDPIISAEASARMMEFERSASSIPSKSSKADNSKEIRSSQGKRKVESVRTCYYAMRKRICHEPLPGDLGFLVQPGDFISDGEAPVPNCMIGHPMEIGLEDANFDDLHHVFPRDVQRSGPTCTVNEFPVLQQDTFEQNNLAKEIPHILGNNLTSSAVGHMDPSKQLASHAIFEANDIGPSSGCNNGKNIMCSGLEGFNTSVADCGTSYHNLQYTSPPPAIPDWKHIDGIPVSAARDDVTMRGDNVHNGDPFGIRDDGGAGKGTSEYDVIPTETKFDDHMSCDELKHATGCTDGFFAELSDTLFNFTPSDKDILSIDGEKDIIDKSFYDGLSLLLNSPDNSNPDAVTNMPEKQEAVAPADYHDIPSKMVPEEHNSGNSHLGDIDVQCNSDTDMPASALTVNSQFPELHDGVICCTLNTEDPDIPSNDDIIFPSKPRSASAHRRAQNEANNPALPGKDINSIQTGGKGVSSMKREQLGESHLPSQTQCSEVGSNQRTDEFGVKKTTKESLNGSRNLSSSHGGSCPSSLIVVKEEPSDLLLVRQPGYIVDKSGHVSDLEHLQAGGDGINQEGQPLQAASNHELYSLGSADPMVTEPGGEPMLSDPEEQFYESDGDIPYFSDIESMILEMDLGPDDQDSFSSRKVAKYQNDDAKRAIIRLEQNAHSYMQRAIASHGAFAVLYGRHSKHYIKKSEILLGRATEDVVVDIDLGREGRANKISRRQAVIKMDKDGSFSLKNLGKCPIYVNNKELFPGQCFVLHSNCLIEIRGMPFIFETNQVCVKKYLENAARKSEARARNI